MFWFWLTLVAVACAADAASTILLVRRGGYEKLSAWVIGKYPDPLKVWAWVFVTPVVVVAALLAYDQRLWFVALIVAAVRGYFAYRNHRLAR